MNKKIIRKTSSQFRRISAQFLSMESEEEFNFLEDLLNFIDGDVILSDYIKKCSINQYDIAATISEKPTWRPLVLPSGIEQVVSYVYQLLNYFKENPNKFRGMVLYYTSDKSYREKYQAFTRKTVAPFINYLLNYLEVCLIDADIDDSNEQNKNTKVFLSYCSKDSAIADIVDTQLQEVLIPYGIYISRDERDVMYKESFKDFMNSIEEHDFVVMIVSDSYLKSRPCMYEVLEIMKNRKYEKKMLFIVLSENERPFYKGIDDDFLVGANVYNVAGRIAYAKYWAREESNLQELIQSIDSPLNTIEPIKELKIIKKILMDIDEFTSMLADRKGISFQKMKESNFAPIIELLVSV
ncbi:toll/interleukin-1 receptor domain-containing protein [Paenibacillus sp. YN15]|uniref:toll/interleukin-1 receptor domain-containing protein n=1 Tax=Paenibacillus sp. YN15 TaxID=1742774 RepID=UPI0015EC0079|nr:toll/interleukin-1 receptor domain-containing protein [Paenibacillus sp. YN15]